MQTDKTDVLVQRRNRCESAMRGLEYDAHIERSVIRHTSSQLTGLPCFLTFVRRVHSNTYEEGFDASRCFASEWGICVPIDRVMVALDAGV